MISRIIKKITISLILLAAVSCASDYGQQRDRAVAKNRQTFNAKIRASGLKPLSFGSSINHDNRKQKTITIDYSCPLDEVHSSRKLLVEIFQNCLIHINCDTNLTPFLDQSPFPPDRLGIGLVNNSDSGIACASIFAEKLSYHSRDSEYPSAPWILIHEETLDEAVAILEQQRTPDKTE